MPRPYRAAISLIAVVLLSSCGSHVAKAPQPTDTIRPPASPQPTQAKAQGANGSQLDQAKLRSLPALIQGRQWGQAEKVLDTIRSNTLSSEDQVRFALYSAQTALGRGNPDEGLSLLNNEALIDLTDQLPLALQTQLSTTRAEILASTGQHLASAQERVFIAPLLNGQARTDNQNNLWSSLNLVDSDELNDAYKRATSRDYRGWISLAITMKDNQDDIDRQAEKIDDWIQAWSSHPAAMQLPDDLALARSLARNRPQHVALLLPLSGDLAGAGQAVLDGFMAAYFHQDKKRYAPKISIYDTNRNTNTGSIYNDAVAAGADVVVGPLSKEEMKPLLDQQALPVPTLALNYGETSHRPPDKLYQLGLAVTDEAIQVARTARAEQRKRAIILSPRAPWGQRSADAFRREWLLIGGQVVAEDYYSNQDNSKTIKTLFEVDRSEMRKQEIQRITGLDLKFEARRRQDIDMIFLVAKPQEAGALKPLIAYHYGADIPVYATSQINELSTKSQVLQDLEGIRFTEIPWLIKRKDRYWHELQPQAQNSPYIRLYALGIDAYYLYPRLQHLGMFANSRFYGRTGDVYANRHHQLVRTLKWAEFSHGEIVHRPDTSDQDKL